MPRPKEAGSIQVRVTVSPTRHPDLHQKLLAMPESQRTAYLLALAVDGASPERETAEALRGLTAAIERLGEKLAGGGVPAPNPAPGGGELPEALNTAWGD